jgi:hypothetical protein
MILNLDFQLVFDYNLSHYFFKIILKIKITSDRQNDRHCDITKVTRHITTAADLI